MSETILYTHVKIPDCSYCNKAKELFEQNNIEFSMQTVGEDLTPVSYTHLTLPTSDLV